MSTVPVIKKPNRREEILTCLAQMLESQPGARLTTAKLAAAVGILALGCRKVAIPRLLLLLLLLLLLPLMLLLPRPAGLHKSPTQRRK